MFGAPMEGRPIAGANSGCPLGALPASAILLVYTESSVREGDRGRSLTWPHATKRQSGPGPLPTQFRWRAPALGAQRPRRRSRPAGRTPSPLDKGFIKRCSVEQFSGAQG